jgi:predicted SAM-dependent methyltransferase
MEDRVQDLLAGIDVENESGLEIGPLDKPIVTPEPGRRIAYLDYADADHLRKRSSHDPNVDCSKIIVPTYVVQSIDDYPRIEERFDYILASHVVEHAPDLLGWIEALLRLLNPRGRIVLAVPDRRFTFDYFRPVSTLGDILEAYFERRRRPTFRQVFDGNNDARNIDIVTAWQKSIDASEASRIFSTEIALQLARSAMTTYQDCHCWVFTYDSFLELIRQVNELGVIGVRIASSVAPKQFRNEFYISLMAPS